MTGAELRAWRERLGKDEAWIEYRRRCVEDGDTHGGIYVGRDVEQLTTAYIAALEAEERAQAECGPVEPVCPEGVTAFTNGDTWVWPNGHHIAFTNGDTWVRPNGHHIGGVSVGSDGAMRLAGSHSTTPACLRYAADLSEYRAAIHAASDKQRKLDAVKAAEAAERDAETAKEIAWQAYDATLAPLGAARDALRTARREAGL